MVSRVTTGAKEREQLERGMTALGLPPQQATIDLLIEYTAQLKKWSRSYNLVSAADLDDIVPRHLLDCLSIHSFLQVGSLLDVGTGAGFPGLPLAIVKPELECTLLDSAGKKIRFLRHVKRTLGLVNIYPEQARLSAFKPETDFDNIAARAFSSLHEFATSVRHLARVGTQLLAMKGKYPQEELQSLPQWLQLLSVEKISVPDLHAERHLVIMSVSG